MNREIIDVMKVDFDGSEKEFIKQLDMEYICKYVKQIIMRTHKGIRFRDLERLEECFMLFRRDTRFYEDEESTFSLSEFKHPNGYKLKLQTYVNETNLAEFMFSTGELYFANRNYCLTDEDLKNLNSGEKTV